MNCEFCGKPVKEGQYGYCNDLCYERKIQKTSYAEVEALLKDCIGKKLLSFDVTPDGGKAILRFENKNVVIGASGNLWDEAFPCFQTEEEYLAWKKRYGG